MVPKEHEALVKDGDPVAAVADAALEQTCCASCGGEMLMPPEGLVACPSCHAALMKGVQAGCRGCGSVGSKLRKGAGGKQGVFALLAAGLLCFIAQGAVEASADSSRTRPSADISRTGASADSSLPCWRAGVSHR